MHLAPRVKPLQAMVGLFKGSISLNRLIQVTICYYSWQQQATAGTYILLQDTIGYLRPHFRLLLVSMGPIGQSATCIREFLDITGHCWGCWPLMAIARRASHCWPLLVTVGRCWLLMATAGHCWPLLTIAGCCWPLLAAAGHCWSLP